jgi:hypothetical protein
MEADERSPEARVLLVVVMRPRDWQAIREEGWYRIPLARAPRALHAEYLAFYPTAACGAERWAVRAYAAVQAVTITTRAALLPDEANHSRAAEPAPAPRKLYPNHAWSIAGGARCWRAVGCTRRSGGGLGSAVGGGRESALGAGDW